MTKYLVLKYIPLEGSWPFLPGLARLFKITFIQNTGAAFGMFPQMGTVLMGIAVVVVIAILQFHRHLPVENIWIRLSLGLQLGGAMGNLLDRIIHGYVVDFVDIGFWPIFNLADSAIVIGVTILAYLLWDEDDPAEKRQQPADEAAPALTIKASGQINETRSAKPAPRLPERGPA